LQTKAQYVIKLAMLAHISDHNDLILTSADLDVALTYLDAIEPNMMRVFEGTGRNDKAPVAAEIKRVIESATEPIPVKTILRQFYKKADNDEIQKILNHLHQTGEIWRESRTMGSLVVPYVGSLEVGAKFSGAKPATDQPSQPQQPESK
jgi:hypothetical protein